ncbi:hypothetical protein [Lysinibacillus sp. JNUCC-52]|uniref:hypothetical protein n=1 Tax=Lysinibacillus sp. JNUCC-52 TaxID=2792480 RepID=UPI001938FA2A|nr:hypothetical protein JNUCC52_00990 [Lysinibacillus sp. JNUCC-52]
MAFIIYFCKEFKRNLSIPSEFLRIRSNFSQNRKHKKYIQILKFLVTFSSGIFANIIFLISIETDKNTNSIQHWVLYPSLALLLSMLLILFLKEDSKSYSTHFKYVGSYRNYAPCDLYLERIVDNSTHILSDKNNEYRAIKYLNNEDFSFVIRLYKLEKREISPLSNNAEENNGSYVAEENN